MILCAAGGAHSVEAKEPASLDELVATYEVGDVPADLLVTVDTSKSMGLKGDPPPWPDVQQGWNALVDSVGPADRLGLITFGRKAAIRLDPEVVDSGNTQQRDKLQLPAVPDGKNTDIGEGLEATVNRLSRGDAAEVQTVVVITDGKANPSDGSAYSSADAPAWDALAEEGKKLTESRRGRLRVYGYAVGNGPTDVDLVSKVFPDAQILAVPPEQLKGFLASLATDAQRERVRPNVAGDLGTSIAATLDVPDTLTEDMTASLVVTNPRKGLPTEVLVNDVTVRDAEGRPVDATLTPTRLVLGPGESAEIPVALKPSGTDHGWLSIGELVDSRTWSVNVDGTTSLSPELTTLLVTEQLATESETRGAVASPGTVDASMGYGISVLRLIVLLLIAAAIAVAVFAFLRWMFVKPRLSGYIIDPVTNSLLLRLSGKEVRLPNASVGDPNGDDSVLLFTKPRGRGRRVWIQRDGATGAPLLGDLPLGRKAKKLVRQDVITLNRREFMYVRELPQ